jgi:hypothetical protein
MCPPSLAVRPRYQSLRHPTATIASNLINPRPQLPPNPLQCLLPRSMSNSIPTIHVSISAIPIPILVTPKSTPVSLRSHLNPLSLPPNNVHHYRLLNPTQSLPTLNPAVTNVDPQSVSRRMSLASLPIPPIERIHHRSIFLYRERSAGQEPSTPMVHRAPNDSSPLCAPLRGLLDSMVQEICMAKSSSLLRAEWIPAIRLLDSRLALDWMHLAASLRTKRSDSANTITP